MNPKPDEVRCKSCGILLAKIDNNGLTICRGGLQATMDGTFRATFRCYRPRCRFQSILQVSTER